MSEIEVRKRGWWNYRIIRDGRVIKESSVGYFTAQGARNAARRLLRAEIEPQDWHTTNIY